MSFLESLSLAVAADAPLPTQDPPAVENEAQRAAYDALAHKLYDKIAGPPEERAGSARGKLASRLWQRVAEWDDRASDDD